MNIPFLSSFSALKIFSLIGDIFKSVTFGVALPFHAVAFGMESLYLCWFFFIAVMALKIAKDAGTLTLADKILGYPVVAVGLVVDAVANITGATIIFLMLPDLLRWSTKTVTLPILGVCRLPAFNDAGLTITARVQNLVNQPTPSWRRTLAL